MSTLACQGCGLVIAADAPSPFRCPNAGSDGGDHIIGRTLASGLRFPLEGPANPFVRFRSLTHAHALASSRGMTDEAFVTLVEDLDRAVAGVAGRGFRETPFQRSKPLSEALQTGDQGGVWIKDETANVAGSHKGRHLMGLATLGEVQARTGIAPRAGQRLAIASCGNAALAAAVVARAWQKPIDVFIPPDANPRVVARLEELGATIHVCLRREGVPGDPCYHAFREAVAGGAFPFCCQGPDNGLTIEGGETLAWEMIAQLARQGRTLDRLFVQVGGGALASACVQALRDAASLGVPLRMPRIHAVQTRGAAPLQRAWEKVHARAAAAGVKAALDHAAKHRAEYMWPWETEPKSVAHGILDDETYDWLAIVRGMIEGGGSPVVVGEERLEEANKLGRERAGIDADATGSAGLAGLLELRAKGGLGAGETVAVLFTGAKR
jgi:threonine synthase